MREINHLDGFELLDENDSGGKKSVNSTIRVPDSTDVLEEKLRETNNDEKFCEFKVWKT